MPVYRQQNVFGLEVAVDDVVFVEMIQCEGDFGGVEFGYWVGEALCGWREEEGGTWVSKG